MRLYIDSVLFNLSGTLVDSRNFLGWAEIGRSLGLSLEAESLAHCWDELIAAGKPSPESNRDVWRELVSRASGAELSAARTEEFITAISQGPLYGALYSDVRKCLELLDSTGRRLGVISGLGTEGKIRRLLDSLGISNLLSVIVAPEVAGVPLRGQQMIQTALKRIECRADGTVFVGDNLDGEVKIAALAGLHAIWLNRFGLGLGGTFPEILSLSEVPGMIRLIEGAVPVK